MDGGKLEKKIHDWATNLGFRLQNGSVPPPQFFAALTATPNRRRLFEVLVESVQDRRKIQHMRKQLLVFSLKDGNRHVNCSRKDTLSRLQLWKRQKEIMEELSQERQRNVTLERDILTRASDLIFDSCKLAEIEKQCNEHREKALSLQLYSKREKSSIGELNELLRSVRKSESRNDQDIKWKEELMTDYQNGMEFFKSCSCQLDVNHNCQAQQRIEFFTEMEVTEDCLWKNVLSSKKHLLERLSAFLQNLVTTDKESISEKKEEIEKIINSSITQLKQQITEKSLLVMINDAEGHLMNFEINKLLDRVEALGERNSPDNGLNENASYLGDGDSRNDSSFSGKNKLLTRVKRNLDCIASQTYRTYLKAEMTRLESEMSPKKLSWRKDGNWLKNEEDTFNTIDSITADTGRLRRVRDDQTTRIHQLQIKLANLSSEIGEKSQNGDFVAEVRETVEKVKRNGRRQIEVFLELPSDALRVVDSSSPGRKSFARESLSRCLDMYGGEFKQFFKTMLIHPHRGVDAILSEVTRRKEAATTFNRFITEREKLAEAHKRIRDKLTSIGYDSELCERNLKESSVIVAATLQESAQLRQSIEFVQKILKNWVEQPYRSMIRDSETVAGLTLKEYEELYRNANKK